MATRKQRRRREKEKRHEYDLVEIDAEGNETVLGSGDRRPEESGAGKRSGSARTGRPARGRGVIQAPSWRRVLKRGAVFAPIFLATVLLLGGSKMTLAAAIVQTVLLVAVFVPFSYFMDRVVWRSQQKRLAKTKTRDA
jgi:hypothetical protein